MRGDGTVVADVRPVVFRLSLPDRKQLERRDPVSREDVVRASGGSIPRVAGIHDDH
jgi:hypothetical protein